MQERAVRWKEDFIGIFNEVIIPKYPKAADLLKWIESTDFFVAPAARGYHSAFEGGLCYHELLVYNAFYDLMDALKPQLPEGIGDAEIALMTLSHDLCKIWLYKQSFRNVKLTKPNGEEYWDKVPAYEYDEKFIFGHGEKSVYLLMRYINNLPDLVYQAIRYHMGGMESAMIDKNSSPVMANNICALLLHLADMYATFGCEERSDNV